MIRQPALPRWVFVPAFVGAFLLIVPVLALVLRTNYADLPALLTSPSALDALSLSIRTSVASTIACTVFGIPLAVVLARSSFRGQRILRSLVLLPLALPPVVGGLALLEAFGRRGLIGQPLDALGISVAFSTVAVVIAQTFVALPFLVLTVEGALRTVDTDRERVAATLGASPARVFVRVTLPAVAPGLISGIVLAWARALGEFGATMTFAGSLQGVTQTLPLQIYVTRSADPEGAVALSLLLVVIALVVTTAAYRPSGVSRPPHTARAPHTRRPAAHANSSEPPVALPHHAPAALTCAVAVPERGLDVSLEVPAGQIVAILGPNGAGKSTLLQSLAGLVTGTSSDHVTLGDQVLAAPGDRPLPVHRRGTAWVPQHRTALASMTHDDVAFGPRSRHLRAADSRATAALTAVGAAHLAQIPAGELSGGQAARTAVARALAAQPDLLLLDEPFAALDVDVAQQVRAALRDALRARPCTTLLVTHDPLDVLVLADRAVVIHDGRIVEDSSARDLLARPRSPFAARLAGVNLVPGTGGDQGDLATDAGPFRGITEPDLHPGAPGVAVFAPTSVAVHHSPPGGSPRNALTVRVVGIEPQGQLVRVQGMTAAGTRIAADLTPGALAELNVETGDEVLYVVKAAEVRLAPA